MISPLFPTVPTGLMLADEGLAEALQCDLLVFAAPSPLLRVFDAAVPVSIGRCNFALVPSLSIADTAVAAMLYDRLRQQLLRRRAP